MARSAGSPTPASAISASHRIGSTSFVTRFDMPIWVSQAGLAQDTDPSDTVGFRWLFSFVPAL